MKRKPNEYRMPPHFSDIPDEFKTNGRALIPPPGGWKPQTYYVVDISVGPTNPLHRAIIYSGFLNPKTGRPAGYAVRLSDCVEDTAQGIDTIRYVEVIREISMEADDV